jgi:hypothetical protein
MHVIFRHDGTGRRVWMLPLRTGAELRTASHLALRDLTVTADPGSRHVARWETLELAQAALLEYAATTRRPAEQYGVQTQVEAVEYANQRRRDYHRKRPYEIEGVDTGGD